MKRFFLSLCCVALLSVGLSSCADEAAEITPDTEISSPQFETDDVDTDRTGTKKPGA
ncbi:hypothetical protein [Nafulsella turpanensis]|uniref:hypothetical protein n=1 Tax=Nafulsella turpanensis TaxID=1265690 RepID=UPI0003462C68|nr:hypothetical protein [Nafulsella turpanensis]